MSKKGIVLLVEDNPQILDINRRVLEDEGLTVLTAATLAEARQRLAIAAPDVVVLDIMLPDGSGLDFLPELRKACASPVLFLTAKVERDDILAGLRAGGNDYITKPYDIEEFQVRVTSFLRLIETAKAPQISTNTAASSGLTERELSIALLAARNNSNKEIGNKFNLSESRVKAILSEIYRKFGITEQDNKRELLAGKLTG
jgi:DNA-binding response OmpR family regulator